MARTSKYITIEGQYAAGVLGTFRIIRGFATLQDLAMISAPYPLSEPAEGGTTHGHQREIIAEHAEDIKRYLQDGNLRFVPEVILSIRANYRDELDDQHRTIGVISDDTPGLTVKRRWKSKNVQTHEVHIERQHLTTLVTDEKRIRRIDGNHRLHLADQLQEDATSPTKYLAPFCVILLGPPDDGNDNYVESMLFHTINNTALPLDSEHALRLILGQAEGYRSTDDDEFATSPALHLTRLLKTRVDALPVPLKQRLGPAPATVLNAASRAMISADPDRFPDRAALLTFADDFCGGLSDILARLQVDHPEFCRAEFFIELASLAWSETPQGTDHQARVDQALKTLEAMGRWLGRDGFHQIQSKQSIAQQLFEIFEAVRKRIPKRIFLARWYTVASDGDEDQKANLRKQMIDRMLNDLRGDDIDLALDDPATETGGTYLIHPKMYTAIAQNDIILIDLSGVRPNVCIEAGYALERHKKHRLLFLFQPTDGTDNNPAYDRPPFDLSSFRYEEIADSGEIPDKLIPHIKAIWEEATDGHQ